MSLPRYLQDNYYSKEICNINDFLSTYDKQSQEYRDAKRFLYSQLNKKCWGLVFKKAGISYVQKNLIPVSICKGRWNTCFHCTDWMASPYKKNCQVVFKNTYVEKYKVKYIDGFKVIKMSGYVIKLKFSNKARVISQTTLSIYREGKDYIFEKDEMNQYTGNVIFDTEASGILSKLERMTKIIAKMIKANTARKREISDRIFSAPMRLVIFERDGYRCKICGRHRDYLDKDERLEADHIKAWVDGGKTKLSNAQTLCSTCNKAKHHVKKLKRDLIQ